MQGMEACLPSATTKMIQLTAGNEVVRPRFQSQARVKPVSVGYTEAYEVGLLENKVYSANGF